MRFTLRDMLWLVALVAMGLSWWLDIRRRDGSVESAQLRKDYYNLMIQLWESELQQLRDQNNALSQSLQRERAARKTTDSIAPASP